MAEVGESPGWPGVVVPSSSGHRAHAPPPLGRGVEALGPRRGLGEAPSAGRAPVTAQCLVCPVPGQLGPAPGQELPPVLTPRPPPPRQPQFLCRDLDARPHPGQPASSVGASVLTFTLEGKNNKHSPSPALGQALQPSETTSPS